MLLTTESPTPQGIQLMEINDRKTNQSISIDTASYLIPVQVIGINWYHSLDDQAITTFSIYHTSE